jgi:hypothetical protein
MHGTSIVLVLIHHGEYFGYLSPELGQPDHIQQILMHKIMQIPCHSMNVKELTPSGNIKVLECLLRQGGNGEPEDKKFSVCRSGSVWFLTPNWGN